MPMRFPCCRVRFLISIPALLSCMLAAADTVIIDNVVSNDPAGWYFVGNSTPTNWLIITNAGALTVSNATVGSEAASTGNVALITGSGSAWTSRNWLIVGSNASDNTLIITNGGWVVSSNASVGFSSSANSNRVFIAWAGSVWSNVTGSANNLSIGGGGSSWNQLNILNGGRFYNNNAAGNFTVGSTNGGSNNSVVISGTGSLFSSKSYVLIGYNAGAPNQNWHNWLWVQNGGQFQGDGYLYIGYRSSSNEVRVAGSNSSFTLSSGKQLVLGYDGGNYNQLIVESNAQMNVDYVYLNYYGSYNSILVDGVGSRFVVTYDNNIGYYYQSGSMIIRNGAYSSCNNGVIGAQPNANGNDCRVTVTDPGSVWSNTASLQIGSNGNVGCGIIISNGGLVKVRGALNLQSGYVTNYFTGRSSGLDLVATNGSINVVTGKIHIVFVSKPATNGFYWGLRWAGNHTNELNTLNTAGQLTWDDSIFRNPFYTAPVFVTYDGATSNTYVGLWFYLTQGIYFMAH